MVETKFHVGDSVYSPHWGEGVVTGIDDNPLFMYPVHVEWTKKRQPDQRDGDIFTAEGNYTVGEVKPWDIVLLEEGDEEMGQIAGVIDHNIQNDIKPWGKFFEDKEDKKVSAEHEKFHVGDFVYSNFSGVGKIVKIETQANFEYPIMVHWCQHRETATFEYDFFTMAGTFYSDRRDANRDIVPIEEVDMEFEEKDDGTIERMEDALNKKVEDAVNPAHYKVKGVPEAIDIINHLMHRCQLEGFLWGNIIKYAYRYGRKGDKAETAGKIEWYARQLKELGECEAEEKEGEGDKK